MIQSSIEKGDGKRKKEGKTQGNTNSPPIGAEERELEKNTESRIVAQKHTEKKKRRRREEEEEEEEEVEEEEEKEKET